MERDITCAKICAKLSIIQLGIARFCSNFVDFDHVTIDVPRTFKVSGSMSQRDITYQHHKLSYKLSKVKLGENHPRAERNT